MYLVYAFFLLMVVIVAGCTPQEATIAPSVSPTTAPEVTSICPTQVEEALILVGTACSDTARNEICYGNRLIEATFNEPDNPPEFDNIGDVIAFTALNNLQLFANLATNEYGIALMRLQTSLPDTLPGQNVTFLLMGNSQFGQDGLNSYYFRSVLGESNCDNIPNGGLLVQTPTGEAEVAFTLNGINVQLGSTAYLEYVEDNIIRVNVIEGRAVLEVDEAFQVVIAGMRSDVALSDDGRAIAPPTIPEPYDLAPLSSLPIVSLERNIAIALPRTLNMTSGGEGNLRVVTMTDELLQVLVTARNASTGEWVDASINGQLSLPAGTYEIEVFVNPSFRQTITIVEGEDTEIQVNPQGTLIVLNADASPANRLIMVRTTDGTVVTSSLGGEIELLAGTYDVEIQTNPIYEVPTTIRGGTSTTITLPAQGVLAVQAADGNETTDLIIVSLLDGTTVATRSGGQITLIEGEYNVQVRTNPAYEEMITIEADQVTLVTLPAQGVLAVQAADGNEITDLIIVSLLDGTTVATRSGGQITLVAGEYNVQVRTNPAYEEMITIEANETTIITLPAQ